MFDCKGRAVRMYDAKHGALEGSEFGLGPPSLMLSLGLQGVRVMLSVGRFKGSECFVLSLGLLFDVKRA